VLCGMTSEIRGRMIDHRGHHAAEADIEAHLYRHENDEEDNSTMVATKPRRS